MSGTDPSSQPRRFRLAAVSAQSVARRCAHWPECHALDGIAEGGQGRQQLVVRVLGEARMGGPQIGRRHHEEGQGAQQKARRAPGVDGSADASSSRRSEAAVANSQFACGRHLHVAGVEAQLHVLRVADHVPAGEIDADEVRSARTLAEQAMGEARICARASWSRPVGGRGEATASDGL